MALTKILIFLGLGLLLTTIFVIIKWTRKDKVDLEELLSSLFIGAGSLSGGLYSFYLVVQYAYLTYFDKILPPLGSENIVFILAGGISLLYLGVRTYIKLLSKKQLPDSKPF